MVKSIFVSRYGLIIVNNLTKNMKSRTLGSYSSYTNKQRKITASMKNKNTAAKRVTLTPRHI